MPGARSLQSSHRNLDFGDVRLGSVVPMLLLNCVTVTTAYLHTQY